MDGTNGETDTGMDTGMDTAGMDTIVDTAANTGMADTIIDKERSSLSFWEYETYYGTELPYYRQIKPAASYFSYPAFSFSLRYRIRPFRPFRTKFSF